MSAARPSQHTPATRQPQTYLDDSYWTCRLKGLKLDMQSFKAHPHLSNAPPESHTRLNITVSLDHQSSFPLRATRSICSIRSEAHQRQHRSPATALGPGTRFHDTCNEGRNYVWPREDSGRYSTKKGMDPGRALESTESSKRVAQVSHRFTGRRLVLAMHDTIG